MATSTSFNSMPEQASAAYLIISKLANIANRLEIDHPAIACQDVWIPSHAAPPIHLMRPPTYLHIKDNAMEDIQASPEDMIGPERLWHMPAARALAFLLFCGDVVTEYHGVT